MSSFPQWLQNLRLARFSMPQLRQVIGFNIMRPVLDGVQAPVEAPRTAQRVGFTVIAKTTIIRITSSMRE